MTNRRDRTKEGAAEMPWVEFLGFESVSSGGGRCEMRFDPSRGHLNHEGVIPAVILYALGQFAGVGSVVAGNENALGDGRVVAKEGNIRFLHPGRGPVTAVGEVDVIVLADALARFRAGEKVDVEAVAVIRDAEEREVAACVFEVALRAR